MQKSPCGLPGWYGTNRLLVYGDEFVKDYFCAGEHAVGVQEGVQEVDGEEAQVGQPLQQAFHAGVADLQHLQEFIILLKRISTSSQYKLVLRP